MEPAASKTIKPENARPRLNPKAMPAMMIPIATTLPTVIAVLRKEKSFPVIKTTAVSATNKNKVTRNAC